MRTPLHHHIKQSILWLGLVLVAFGTAHASGNEDDKPKDRTQPSEGKASATQAEALRMQKAMTKALSSLNLDFANVEPENILQPLVADETNAPFPQSLRFSRDSEGIGLSNLDILIMC